jgi:Fe-S-cluster containining protein
MTRRPADVRAELDALYAELPEIECRGQCFDSCGAISMTRPERRRIAERGIDIAPTGNVDGGLSCNALTVLKRCSVYAIRPMICRLWGLTRVITSYGCVPEGGWLTEAQAYEYLARAEEIAGNRDQAARYRAVATEPQLAHRLRREVHGPDVQIALAERRWNMARP